MKKILVITLTLIMMASVIGCGKSQTEETKETEAVVETQAEVQTEAQTDAEETEAETVAEKAEKNFQPPRTYVTVDNPGLVHPVIKEMNEGAQDDENMLMYTMKYTSISLNDEETEKYPELEMAIREDLDNYIFMTAMEGRETIAAAFEEGIPNEDAIGEIFYDVVVAPRRVDENYFSALVETSSFLGGAHPDYSCMAFNYATQTGELVRPVDVFTSQEEFNKALADNLNKQQDNDYFEDDLEAYLNDNYAFDNVPVDGLYCYNMLLGYGGVKVYFNPYEIAPWASGRIEVFLPYSEYASIINPGFDIIPENYVAQVESYQGIYTDEGTVTITGDMSGTDYVAIDKIIVDVDGNECTISTFTYDMDNVIIKTSDGIFLYIFCNADDDEEYIEMFEIADSKATYCGRKKGNIFKENKAEEPNQVGEFNCYARSNTFNYFGDPNELKLSDGATYKVGEDGVPAK